MISFNELIYESILMLSTLELFEHETNVGVKIVVAPAKNKIDRLKK